MQARRSLASRARGDRGARGRARRGVVVVGVPETAITEEAMTAERTRETDRGEAQCPSCGASIVQQLSVVGGMVWLLCARCGLRWSITDRRSPTASAYQGFERRRPVIG